MKTKYQNAIEKTIGIELSRILVVVILALISTEQFAVAQDARKKSESELGSGDLGVRIELADAELNLLYGKVLAKLQKEEAESLRIEQREWLKRMEQAPTGGAERLDYLLSRNQHLREFLTKPSGDPPKSFTSPDGSSTVRILHTPMPGKTDDSEEHWTLEVLQGGNSLLKVATYGYLLSCKWSADGNFVAINNRRANSGDYVWVVDLEARKVVKQPDDELSRSWYKNEMLRFGDVASVDRDWITAKYWEKNGLLRYQVEVRVTGKVESIAAEGVHKFAQSNATASTAMRQNVAHGELGILKRSGEDKAGADIPPDEAVASEIKQRALEGDAESQYIIGHYYLGLDKAGDIGRAAEWFSRSAAQGHAEALADLGRCHLYGVGVNVDLKKSYECFLRSAEKGSAAGQAGLGLCFLDGYGTKVDEAKAVNWFQKAADQKEALGEAGLGMCYVSGKGTKPNQEAGLKRIRNAANLGDAYGQAMLGCCFLAGKGCQKDLEAAKTWLEKAAEQGIPDAQFTFGFACVSGIWGRADADIGNTLVKKSLVWIRSAASQDCPSAQCSLGMAYGQGIGVPRNPGVAVEWWKKAAEQNDPNAQFWLGAAYAAGIGVQGDQIQAMKWLSLSAEQGNENARSILMDTSKAEESPQNTQKRKSIKIQNEFTCSYCHAWSGNGIPAGAYCSVSPNRKHNWISTGSKVRE